MHDLMVVTILAATLMPVIYAAIGVLVIMVLWRLYRYLGRC